MLYKSILRIFLKKNYLIYQISIIIILFYQLFFKNHLYYIVNHNKNRFYLNWFFEKTFL